MGIFGTSSTNTVMHDNDQQLPVKGTFGSRCDAFWLLPLHASSTDIAAVYEPLEDIE